MNTTSKNRSKSVSYAAFALVALLFGAAGVQAQEVPKSLTKTVAYGDLNLESPKGAETLYARLRRAAEAVCVPFDSREMARKHLWQTCYDNALTAAVAQINHTSLTALHNDRARGPKETKGS
jgi:UrcA family protein